MIALVLEAAGNCTSNDVEQALSPPKSRTHTVGFPPPDLYINAPRQVNAAGFHVEFENDKYAVVFVGSAPVVGVTDTVSVLPPAVYPVPVISPLVVYAEVVGPRLAVSLYNAILNVSDAKLNVPEARPVLKVLVAP